MSAAAEAKNEKTYRRDDAFSKLKLLVNGIKKKSSQPLSNITSFPGDTILDLARLEVYAKTKMRFQTEAYNKEITGDSIVEMARNYCSKFSVEGRYGFAVGAAVSGSMASEFGCSSESTASTKFAQVRKIAKFAMLSLPNSGSGRDSLRELADARFLKNVDAVSDEESAKQLIDDYGCLYMQSATLGACLTMSSKSSSTEHKSSLNVASDLAMEYTALTASVKTSAHFSMGRNAGHKNSKMEILISCVGGDPTYILRGDEAKWIDSAKYDLAVVDFSLAPISDFAPRRSTAEKLLLKAVKQEATQELGKFKLSKKTPAPSDPLDGKTFLFRNKFRAQYYDKWVSFKSNGKALGLYTDRADAMPVLLTKVRDGIYIMQNMWDGEGKKYISFANDGRWLYARYDKYDDAMPTKFHLRSDGTYLLENQWSGESNKYVSYADDGSWLRVTYSRKDAMPIELVPFQR